MIANILIAFACLLLVITVIEHFATETQKLRFENWFLSAWNTLDESRKAVASKWSRRMDRPSRWEIIAAFIWCPIFLRGTWIVLVEREYILSIEYAEWELSFVVTCLLMPILYILLRFAQSRIAFLIVFAAIGAFCIGTTVGIVIFVPDPPLADPYRDVIRPGELMHFTAVGTTLSILAMGIGSIINVGATYVAIYFLAGIEFIVRRIAENPKGPFLTMSVTLGAIAALLKAFS